jgi:replication factor A2
VTGVLKTFGQKRYINALNVRPVKNPLEPHFHILDVMYADVAAQRGPVRGPILLLASLPLIPLAA